MSNLEDILKQAKTDPTEVEEKDPSTEENETEEYNEGGDVLAEDLDEDDDDFDDDDDDLDSDELLAEDDSTIDTNEKEEE